MSLFLFYSTYKLISLVHSWDYPFVSIPEIDTIFKNMVFGQLFFYSFLFWVIIETEVHLFPFHNKSQDPKKIDQHTVPFNNYNKLIALFLILVRSCQKSIDTVNPHAKNVESKYLFNHHTSFSHNRSVPVPKFGDKGSDPHNYDHPNDKESDGTRAMQFTDSLLIDGSDCNGVTNHRELYYVEIRFAECFMSNADTLVFQPSKNDVERQSNHRRGNQHCVSEDDVLRVVGSCAGDCGPWERLLFMMTHSHMIGVQGSAEKDWYVDVDEGVKLESAKHLPLILGAG